MDKNIHYIIELYKAYYIFNSEIQTKRWDNKETWNLKNNDLYLWIEKSPCDFLKPRVSEVSEGTFSPRNNVLLDGFVCSEILLTPMEESSARTIKRPVHRVGKLLFDEMFFFFLPISTLNAVIAPQQLFSKIPITCSIKDMVWGYGYKGTTRSLCYFYFSIFTLHEAANI